MLWVIVPAPLYDLWLVAVVASEWSLYVGSVGLCGAALGAAAARRGRMWAGGGALLCGALATVLSFYPLLSTLPVAAAYGVRLSLARYIFASASPAAHAPQTFVYSTAHGQPLQLDAYLPEAPPAVGTAGAAAASLSPAVVVVHGGSWSGGSRSDFPQWDGWLASHGYAVFDIDYRLAPQPNWQTAVADVKQAVRWVKEHARGLRVDATKVALLGRSAGGQLALLAAYTADEPADEAEMKSADGGASVRAVIACYAPTDLRWAYQHPANQRVIDGPATLRRLTGGTPESVSDIYDRASPTTYAGRGSPPTLLIHGGRDQLVREENMSRLAEALQHPEAALPSAGAGSARHNALLIPYAQHGFDYNFNGWGAQVMQRVLLDFLDAHLKGI